MLETLPSVLRALEIPIGECSIGGGSAIDARLQHRESHDIDANVASGLYQEMYERPGKTGIRRAIRDVGPQAGGASERGIQWNKFITQVDNPGRGGSRAIYGVASLYAGSPLEGGWECTEVEARYGIPLAPTGWILQGKLEGRMAGRLDILPRDAHDLLVCAREDAESVRQAVQEIEREDWAAVAETIRRGRKKDPEWHGTRENEKNQRIVNARYATLVGSGLWDEVLLFCDKGPEEYLDGLHRHKEADSTRRRQK